MQSLKILIYVPLFETPSVNATTAALIEEICGDNSECAYDIAVTGSGQGDTEQYRGTHDDT